MDTLPLSGIRVCDFTWVVVGPNCTQMLALMGAEVIKIETNEHTCITRRTDPFLDGIYGEERSGTFHSRNMSKMSCTLNLTHPKAMEIVKEIIAISDIVMENFRVGVMKRLGLGYDVLKEIKPDLIMVSASGMGSTGPKKDYVCYNEEAYAYGGLGYLTGYEDEMPSTICGDYADYVSSNCATFAILAALHHRSKTGEGQFIDLSMSEVIATHIPEAIMDYTMNQRIKSRMGNHSDEAAPHDCYPCKGKDKWAAISVSTDKEWKDFCEAVDHPNWIDDDRFNSRFQRNKNRSELNDLISKWTRNHAPREVMEILQKVGVAAGPSLNIEELTEDPHLNDRGFFVAPEHPEVGKRIHEGLPWKMSGSRPVFKPAPLLGEHNYQIFHDLLGMSDEMFAQLVDEGVIY